MSNGSSQLVSVSLGVALAFILFVCTPLAAQTNGQTRPRSLTSSPENSATPNESDFQVGSPEAIAEAKRLYKIGAEYGHAGLFTQAAELFQRAVKLRPDYADAYRGLGHAYCDLKQWRKAIPSLEQALLLNPKDKDSRKRLELARSMVEAERTNQPGLQERASSAESLNVNSQVSTVLATKVAAGDASLTKVYRVGPGDVLDVRFNDAPSAEPTPVSITTSGSLEHPSLSEPLPVSGLTVEEISVKLEGVLKRQAASPNNNVSVVVRDYVSHAIIVSGLVKEPGTKILRREAIPLYVVIADAQPLPDAAKATVVRNESNEVFSVDLANPAETSLLIRSGDVITVQANPTEFFYVSGDVKSPGEKIFRRGMTLTQAIITAGGLTGKSGRVQLARDDGRGFLVVTRYKLADIDSGKLQDPLVQPGDRITITN
jgi:protein involved in polysaccharide export with SLBB domain